MKSIHEICGVKFAYDQFIEPLCQELARRDYKVYVSYNGEEIQSKNDIDESKILFEKISFYRSTNILKMLKGILSIRKAIASTNPEIIHIHTPLLAYLARIAVMSHIIRGKTSIVYTIHGFYFHQQGKKLSNIIHFGVEWILSMLCEKMLFVSYKDYKIALRYFPISKERLYYVGNGVNVEIFKKQKDIAKRMLLREKCKFKKNEYVVGFVGRYVKEKGLIELINAAIKLKKGTIKELRLLLIGGLLESDYDGSNINEVNSKITENSNFIVNVGFIESKEKLADYYNIMDVFCLPSYREGMPTSLIEAMSCGVPSIASDIRGCNELIRDKRNGILVKPGNSRELMKAIEFMYEKHTERKEFAETSRKMVIEQYNLKNIVRDTADIIEGIEI